MTLKEMIISRAFVDARAASPLQDDIRAEMMSRMFVPEKRFPEMKEGRGAEIYASGFSKVQTRVLLRFWLPKSRRFVPLTIHELHGKEGGKSHTVKFHVDNLIARKAMTRTYVKVGNEDVAILELTQVGKDAALIFEDEEDVG